MDHNKYQGEKKPLEHPIPERPAEIPGKQAPDAPPLPPDKPEVIPPEKPERQAPAETPVPKVLL